MDEKTWLACQSLGPMVGLLDDKATERKLRLFGTACCRRLWHLLSDERTRQAVEISEGYADETVSKAELDLHRRAAWEANRYVTGKSYSSSYDRTVVRWASEAVAKLTSKKV